MDRGAWQSRGNHKESDTAEHAYTPTRTHTHTHTHNRDTDIENRLVNTGGEEKGRTN